MYDLFISYHRKDSEYARTLAEELTYFGISIWYAEFEILLQGRKRLQDEEILRSILINAAKESKYCLFLMSKDSLKSKWVIEVELATFFERERNEHQENIIPVIIPSGNDNIDSGWIPDNFNNRTSLLYGDPKNIEDLVKSILEKINKSNLGIKHNIDRNSKKTITLEPNLVTKERKIPLSIEIGAEWEPAGKKDKDMLLFARNIETNMFLNIIVGYLSKDYIKTTDTQSVEEDNYFAEEFIKRGLNRRKVAGSHLINVAGKPHFSFTYSRRFFFTKTYSRQYSIILNHPQSERLIEFVFTASYKGSYKNFLSRIGRVDTIVRSLKFK
jgi:hypothetical protein